MVKQSDRTERPKGTGKECRWKPIGKDWCFKKKRPVNDECSCADDFEEKVSLMNSKPTPKKKAVSVEKPKLTSKISVVHKELIDKETTLNEEYLYALDELMIGADEVVIRKNGFRISITKEG